MKNREMICLPVEYFDKLENLKKKYYRPSFSSMILDYKYCLEEVKNLNNKKYHKYRFENALSLLEKKLKYFPHTLR